MPELPEIETIKLQLQKVLIGQTSLKFEILNIKTIRGDLKRIVGRKVEAIERLGKVLLIKFADDIRLGFHFKMTGQLIYDPTSPKATLGAGRIVGGHPTEDFINKLPSKHTRVILYFSRGTLYFNDQRKFGWVEINPKFVENLGPEPINMTSDEVNQVMKLIKRLRRPIKVVIMDQKIICGVGNIYANDALWESGIHPNTSCTQLSEKKLKLLFEKIILVLNEGIKYGGATAANYVDLHGLGGHYQDHFRVYNREGLPCFRCETKIQKITLGGRGTYYCPNCQKSL